MMDYDQLLVKNYKMSNYYLKKVRPIKKANNP